MVARAWLMKRLTPYEKISYYADENNGLRRLNNLDRELVVGAATENYVNSGNLYNSLMMVNKFREIR